MSGNENYVNNSLFILLSGEPIVISLFCFILFLFFCRQKMKGVADDFVQNILHEKGRN